MKTKMVRVDPSYFTCPKCPVKVDISSLLSQLDINHISFHLNLDHETAHDSIIDTRITIIPIYPQYISIVYD